MNPKEYLSRIKMAKPDKVLFGIAFFLMSLIFINHFLTILNYSLKLNAQIILFPLSFIITVVIFLLFSKELRLDKKGVILSLLLSLLILTGSFLIASAFYDFSWDGLWYHQAAVYFLEEGWNPLYEVKKEFTNCAAGSVIHFTKGPWYFAANIFSTFGDFEAAKCLSLIVICLVYLTGYTTARAYNLSVGKSHIIAAILTLNPVIIGESLSFLVDHLLIAYLIIYIVTLVKWLKDKSVSSILMSIMASVALINTKFTGLIFFLIASFFIFIYLVLNNRPSLKQYIKSQFLVMVIGVFVFGYNPYVTNTIHWGHPFYPVIDPNTNLSPEEQDLYDINEQWETPKNMVGKSVFYRFYYATFSRPGNAPFNGEKDAKLMLPFTSKPSDWLVYRYHEARVSGFGPFFSGVLVLAFVLAILISIKSRKTLQILLLVSGGILVSVFLNRHFWIPRFAPQLWYLPIIPVIISWTSRQSKKTILLSYLIAFIVLINSLIVSYVHFNWEMKSTAKLNTQLVEIKNSNNKLLVHCHWFKKAMEERLTKHEIQFEFVQWAQIETMNKTELQTIVDKYPGKVFFSYKE